MNLSLPKNSNLKLFSDPTQLYIGATNPIEASIMLSLNSTTSYQTTYLLIASTYVTITVWRSGSG